MTTASQSNVLVIGARGAIGRAVCSLAGDRGMTVLPAARQGGGGYLSLDVTDDASIDALVESLPPLELVVFAQGRRPEIPLRSTTRAHLLAMFDVHVAATLVCLQKLTPRLTPGSSVALISSVAVRKGSYDPGYAAVKGAISALTRSLSIELKGVARVNAVAPGLVEDSPVHHSMLPEHAARHADRMGGRLIAAEAVARLIFDLHANASINGSVVAIDGGLVE